MATEKTVWGFEIMPEINRQGMAKVTKAVADAMSMGVLDADTATRFNKMAAGAAKSFGDIIGKAEMYGMRKEADRWQKQMIETQNQVANITSKMAGAKMAADASGDKAGFAATKKQLELELEGLNARLTVEMKGVEHQLDRRKEAYESLANFQKKSAGQAAQDLGSQLEQGVSGAFGQMSSKDLAGLTRSLAGSLGKAGKMAQVKGGQMAAAGGAGAGMGKAIAGIGAAAAVLAGVVVALAAVIKMMVDAESQAKEFNAAIMEGAGAADFAYTKSATGIIDMTKQLDAARGVALELAMEFRGDAKELLGVMSAANAAGLTFKEMEKNFSDSGDAAEAYRNFTRMAVVQSKLLGASTKEIAEQTAKWTHEFGMGLTQVRDSFSAISSAAMESGINVKRFYSMVTNATGNMALYNGRIEEAAALMGELGKSLGETNAASFVEGLTKGFAADSYTERFKKMIIAGKGDMQEIMENSAVSTAKAFSGKFGKAVERIKEDTGIDIDAAIGGDPAELVKLGKMGEKDIRALLEATESGEERRELEKLVELSRGMTGGISNQAKALDALDMGGKLATMLSTTISGPISEMSALELAAFENYSGISGQNLVELRKVDRQLRGQYDIIADQAKLARDGKEMDKEQVEKLAKMGVVIDENGKATVKSTGKQIDSINDWIQSQGDTLAKAVEGGMSEQDAQAKLIAQNTTSMSNQLETGLQVILENIYDVMSSILDWEKGLEPKERKARAELQAKLEQQGDVTAAALEKNAGELADARMAYDQAVGADRDAKKAIVDGLESDRDKLDLSVRTQRDMLQELNGIAGGGVFGLDKDSDAMMSEITSSTAGRKKEMIGEKFGPEAVQTIEAAGDAAAKAASDKTKDAYHAMDAGPAKERAYRGLDDRAENAAKGARATAEGTAADQFLTPTASGDTEALLKGEQEMSEAELEQLEALPGMATDIIKTTEATEGVEDAVGDLNDDMSDNVSEGTIKGMDFMAAKELVGASGVTDPKQIGILAKKLMGGDTKTRTAVTSGLAGGASDQMRARAAGFGLNIDPPAEDFLYRGDAGGGTITPFNKRDDLLGAKAGGALDKFGGGGGGPTNVTININGGDQAKVFATVKKALRAAGVSPAAGRTK